MPARRTSPTAIEWGLTALADNALALFRNADRDVTRYASHQPSASGHNPDALIPLIQRTHSSTSKCPAKPGAPGVPAHRRVSRSTNADRHTRHACSTRDPHRIKPPVDHHALRGVRYCPRVVCSPVASRSDSDGAGASEIVPLGAVRPPKKMPW